MVVHMPQKNINSLQLKIEQIQIECMNLIFLAGEILTGKIT